MSAGGVLDRNDRLPPKPSSAAQARTLVRDTLAASPLAGTDAVDTAVLLVSEVVSNAVLHARTGIEVRVTVHGAVARVEVRDGSTVVPSRRDYDDEASTGRGLELVEILASAWGTGLEPLGKVVWFEVGEVPADDRPDAATDPEPAHTFEERPDRDTTVVRFLGLPVALTLATLEYGDAVLREIALSSHPDGRSSVTGLDLSGILGPTAAAFREGVAAVDIDVPFPPSAVQGARDRLAMVDEAHRLALDGQMLALPSVPEITLCRSWLMGEIQRQMRGEVPTPWHLPAPVDVEHEWRPLSAAELADVASMTGAVIIGDDSNRIIHASEDVEGLLGWAVHDLVGRRLTTIIPPALREAHLVGFTRFQLTGEGPILGQRITVPAWRSDGTTVDVDLEINVMPRVGGRMFRAQLCATAVGPPAADVVAGA